MRQPEIPSKINKNQFDKTETPVGMDESKEEETDIYQLFEDD